MSKALELPKLSKKISLEWGLNASGASWKQRNVSRDNYS